jgi:hypothetical protein
MAMSTAQELHYEGKVEGRKDTITKWYCRFCPVIFLITPD